MAPPSSRSEASRPGRAPRAARRGGTGLPMFSPTGEAGRPWLFTRRRRPAGRARAPVARPAASLIEKRVRESAGAPDEELLHLKGPPARGGTSRLECAGGRGLARARRPGLDRNHGADAALADGGEQLLEAWPCNPRTGAAEIVVDHLDGGPPQRPSALDQGVLGGAGSRDD